MNYILGFLWHIRQLCTVQYTRHKEIKCFTRRFREIITSVWKCTVIVIPVIQKDFICSQWHRRFRETNQQVDAKFRHETCNLPLTPPPPPHSPFPPLLPSPSTLLPWRLPCLLPVLWFWHIIAGCQAQLAIPRDANSFYGHWRMCIFIAPVEWDETFFVVAISESKVALLPVLSPF